MVLQWLTLSSTDDFQAFVVQVPGLLIYEQSVSLTPSTRLPVICLGANQLS
jgi:hypothetical protein